MKKDIINQIIEVLDKAEKVKTAPSYKAIIAKLFNTLKDDKEEDYKNFKSHVDDECNCNCGIEAYYEAFGKLSDDELKEIIKENNITKDIFENFDKILFNKFVDNNINIKCTIDKTRKRMDNIFTSNDKGKNLEDMTKEELINMIRKKAL